MKTKSAALALLACFLLPLSGLADDDAKTEGEALFTKLRTKLQQSELRAKMTSSTLTAKDLEPEFSQFDALLKKYKDQKTDAVAQILIMKAMVHIQLLDETAAGLKLIDQLKKEFPDTKPGQQADQIVESIKAQAEARKAQAEGEKIKKNLAVGKPFPDFKGKNLAGKEFSLADYKGKVVLIDFWATWCGSCVQEIPHVKEAYKKYHAKGFDVIGISLDRSRGALESYIKEKDMPWTQHFDEGGLIASRYGVTGIPTVYLLDGKGNIAAMNTALRGPGLDKEVKKALGGE